MTLSVHYLRQVRALGELWKLKRATDSCSNVVQTHSFLKSLKRWNWYRRLEFSLDYYKQIHSIAAVSLFVMGDCGLCLKVFNYLRRPAFGHFSRATFLVGPQSYGLPVKYLLVLIRRMEVQTKV